MSRIDFKEPESPVLANDFSSHFKSFENTNSSKTFPQNTQKPVEPHNGVAAVLDDDPPPHQARLHRHSPSSNKDSKLAILRSLATRSAVKRSSNIDYSTLRVLKTNEELDNIKSVDCDKSNATKSYQHEELSSTAKPRNEAKKDTKCFQHLPYKGNQALSNASQTPLSTKTPETLQKGELVPSNSNSINNLSTTPALVAPKIINQELRSSPSDIICINGQNYRIMRMLGEGGSSKVYEAYDSERKLKAIKFINLSEADKQSLESYLNEINVLKSLQHSDRVIKLFDYEYNPVKKFLLATLERGDTDFASYLKSRTAQNQITPEMIKFYWSEMLRAVEVIHNAGIIHSDLKPANFLIVRGHLKLIDFGISSFISSDATSIIKETMVGSLSYISPEALTDTQSSDPTVKGQPKIKIGVKSDVWSLGCILYHMTYGNSPFYHLKDAMKMMLAIVNPEYKIVYPSLNDTFLLDAMQKCIVHRTQQRASIKELLEHPYLTGESEKNLDSFLNQLMVKLSPTSTSKVQKALQQLQLEKSSAKCSARNGD